MMSAYFGPFRTNISMSDHTLTAINMWHTYIHICHTVNHKLSVNNCLRHILINWYVCLISSESPKFLLRLSHITASHQSLAQLWVTSRCLSPHRTPVHWTSLVINYGPRPWRYADHGLKIMGKKLLHPQARIAGKTLVFFILIKPLIH